MKLRDSELWTIIGLLVSIIIGIASFLGVKTHFITKDNVDSIVSSIFLFLMGLLITEKLTSFVSARDIDNKLFALQRKPPILIPSSAETIYIGSAREASQHLISIQRADAWRIRNTYFPDQHSGHRSGDYTTIEEQNVVDSITEFVRSGKEWHDVVSLAGKERLEELGKSFKRNNVNPTGFYFPHLINNNFPIINFILVYYHPDNKNKNTEVYFGWGLHKNASFADVFMSENKEIVSFFENYWSTLGDLGSIEDMEKYM